MSIIYTYPTKGSPSSSDLIIISDSDDNNATKQATLGTALTGAAIAAGTASSAATAGTAGQLMFDASYIYVCTVTGIAGAATWRRVATIAAP